MLMMLMAKKAEDNVDDAYGNDDGDSNVIMMAMMVQMIMLMTIMVEMLMMRMAKIMLKTMLMMAMW